jgi:hypothetical protein
MIITLSFDLKYRSINADKIHVETPVFRNKYFLSQSLNPPYITLYYIKIKKHLKLTPKYVYWVLNSGARTPQQKRGGNPKALRVGKRIKQQYDGGFKNLH